MAEMNEATIRKDRLRFTKNKLSANLVILSIVANALYFVDIYRSNVGNYYYTLLIGISVVYNLVFMLAAFLSSEGLKNYKLSYCFVAIVLGIIQAGRIFWLPISALNAPNPVVGAENATVMTGGQFAFVTACLVISAALLVIAGITGIIKTTTLNNYRAELEKNDMRS